jgi:hypothetical protein
LVVLCVNAWDEPKRTVQKFVEKKKLMQRMLLDGGGIANDYAITSVPTVFWIDSKGRVVDTEIGFGGPGILESKTKRLLSLKP